MQIYMSGNHDARTQPSELHIYGSIGRQEYLNKQNSTLERMRITHANQHVTKTQEISINE